MKLKNLQIQIYTYDAFHQPTQITDITGTTTTLTYTAWGAPLSVSANGKTTSMVYNAAGQLVQTKRNGLTLGTTSYDAKGRVSSQTDAAGLTVSYEYNNLDYLTKESYSDGTNVTYDYTCCGLVGVVKDRAGRRSYYDYDVMRRLARVQDASGNTLQMDYDAKGQLVRLLDGKGNITRWAYDGLGRLTKKTYHDGKEQTYGYSGGRLSATRDGRGVLTNFGYDANGNLTLIDYANMADVSMTYNALDKPLTQTDGLGTTSFAYDTAGRLTGVDGPWANDTVSYAYNADGQRSALGVQKSNGAVDTTSYAYDSLGRLTALQNALGTFGYGYVGNTGRIASLSNPNGTGTSYSYTALGELDVLHNTKAGGGNISRYDYAYDARGVRSALQEQIEADPVKTLLFSYDQTNQLTGEAVSGGNAGEAYNTSYTYDASGNRTKKDVTQNGVTTSQRSSNNALNQTTSLKTSVGANAPITSGFSYDAAGNVSQVSSPSGSTHYSFDDASRLSSLITKDANGVNQSKTEFTYDGLSRLRISKTFAWTGGAWVQNGETRRVYDGMNVVQERDGAGDTVVSYVRGPDMGGGIGGLLARASSSGTNAFYHYDGRGNVTGLSDAAGNVSGRYAYDAFGVLLSSSGVAAGANSYRFSTKEHIGALVYYGYRFYSASLGKWINRDPIKENGGVNLYGFAANNPVKWIDSHGLSIVDTIIDEGVLWSEGFWEYLSDFAKCILDYLKGLICSFFGGIIDNPIGSWQSVIGAGSLWELWKLSKEHSSISRGIALAFVAIAQHGATPELLATLASLQARLAALSQKMNSIKGGIALIASIGIVRCTYTLYEKGLGWRLPGLLHDKIAVGKPCF